MTTKNGVIKGVLLTSALLISAGAFASSKGSMELLRPATVAGTQLQAGSYRVEWDGQGEQVQVQIFQGKKQVAATSARMVKLEHPVPDNSVVVVPSNDGSRSVSRINFGKKDFALELGNEAGAGSGAAAGAAK